MAYHIIHVKFPNTCVFPSNAHIARDQLKSSVGICHICCNRYYRSDRAQSQHAGHLPASEKLSSVRPYKRRQCSVPFALQGYVPYLGLLLNHLVGEAIPRRHNCMPQRGQDPPGRHERLLGSSDQRLIKRLTSLRIIR